MTRKLLIAAVALGVSSLGAAPARAQGTLSVTFSTTPTGGNYAPRNIVAAWIEDAGGGFVKTIGRWAATRRSHLVAWATASGQDADAVSGATRSSHNGTLTATWDLRDRAGAEVPDGTYTIRLEVADSNANTAGQNNQGTFSFVKGPTSTSSSDGTTEFPTVAIDYSAASATCDNGVIDSGETCDPPGTCPTSCAASGDACAPNQLVGSAAGCTAECVPQAITACVSGDGCCPASCDPASDDDCAGGGGDDTGQVTGGCATGGGGLGHGAAGLVLAAGLWARRRRRG